MPAPGTVTSFAVLGGTTVTNTGPSVISGDLGVSRGAAVTGFPPGIVNDGAIHAADAVAAPAHHLRSRRGSAEVVLVGEVRLGRPQAHAYDEVVFGRPPSAERIVAEAMRLFAANGYAATSVGAIEAAAGFTPRASGMYRHFPSKQAVLEAGIADQLGRLEALHRVDTPFEGVDGRDVLELIARVGLAQLAAEASLIRVLHRDLEAFPELMEQVKERLVRATYSDFAGRLREAAKAGQIAEADFEAVAAVAIGAIVNYGVSIVLFDEPPGAVDEDRFVSCWAEMVHDAMWSPRRPGDAQVSRKGR